MMISEHIHTENCHLDPNDNGSVTYRGRELVLKNDNVLWFAKDLKVLDESSLENKDKKIKKLFLEYGVKKVS